MQLEYNNQRWVAKKLVDIGQGRGSVTLEQAERFMIAELIRIRRMDYFMTSFKALAGDRGAEIAGT